MGRMALVGILLLEMAMISSARAEDPMTTRVRQLIKQVEDSFMQGRIFHIDYTVNERRTDAFYERRRQLIFLLKNTLGAAAKSGKETEAVDASSSQREQALRDMLTGFTREMGAARECSYSLDYSVDGVGFYLKQLYSFVGASGSKLTLEPTVYVSDGKLMGTFYLKRLQAVIEPATERPQTPSPHWTVLAYSFMERTLSSYLESLSTLTMIENPDELVIT